MLLLECALGDIGWKGVLPVGLWKAEVWPTK